MIHYQISADNTLVLAFIEHFSFQQAIFSTIRISTLSYPLVFSTMFTKGENAR
jgi:hypothetical protein